ncbi:MAG: hypothetical protein Q9157_001589 [Trypethelium eluteriae]
MVCPEHRWADLERVATLKRQDIMRRAGSPFFDEVPVNATLPCWCGKLAASTDEVRECAGCQKPARFPFQLYQRPWRAPFRRGAVRRTNYEVGRAPVAVPTTIGGLEPCVGLIFGYCRGGTQAPTAETNDEAWTVGSPRYADEAQFGETADSLSAVGPASSTEGDLGQCSSRIAEHRPVFARERSEAQEQAESDHSTASGTSQENHQPPSRRLLDRRTSERTSTQQRQTAPSLSGPATPRKTVAKHQREAEVQSENDKLQRKRRKDSPITRQSTKQAKPDDATREGETAHDISSQKKKTARAKDGSCYLVEEILDSRRYERGKYEFFVKWLGEPADRDDDQNWLSWERIGYAEDFLADFRHAHPDRAMPPTFRPPKGWNPLPAGQPRAWLDHRKPQYFEHNEDWSEEG